MILFRTTSVKEFLAIIKTARKRREWGGLKRNNGRRLLPPRFFSPFSPQKYKGLKGTSFRIFGRCRVKKDDIDPTGTWFCKRARRTRTHTHFDMVPERTTTENAADDHADTRCEPPLPLLSEHLIQVLILRLGRRQRGVVRRRRRDGGSRCRHLGMARE